MTFKNGNRCIHGNIAILLQNSVISLLKHDYVSRLLCFHGYPGVLQEFKQSICPTYQIFVSKKWGFTKFDKEVYEKGRADGSIIPAGVHAQYHPSHGPLAAWKKRVAA